MSSLLPEGELEMETGKGMKDDLSTEIIVAH
jgi:hypothetical protein